MLSKFPTLAVVAVCALIAFPSQGAAPNFYTEDFTTTAFRDMAGTTADWSTADGELKLFPFVPTLVGNYNTSFARGVAVDGDHAFVAAGDSGLQIMDISDPDAPTLVGSYVTPGSALDVAVVGDLAFVADNYSGLQIVDISDPAAPTLVGSFDTPSFVWDVTVAGDLAFVADSDALQIVDVSDPAVPTLVGSIDTLNYPRGVVVAGDLAFVANHESGLQIVDISNPAAPALVGSYDTPGVAWGVVVAGGLAFVADQVSGLQIVDISDPAAPTLVGSYDTPSSATGVAVSGDRAYVADNYSGLHIVDISDPAAPTLVGSYNTPGIAYDVAVSGDRAFVADAYGLRIVDISDPIAPTLVGIYDTLGYARNVTVSGARAFVDDNYSGLHIVDISDPAAPTLVGRYDTPSEVWGVAVDGALAYVAGEVSGLLIVDISDPAAPTLLGSYDTPDIAFGVAVSGDRAFVADGYSGLQIVDISDSAAPTLVGIYDTPGYARNVTVSGDRAFVADSHSGLLIVDISDPAAPTLVGSYDTPGSAVDVTVSGDRAFVADYQSGLQIVDISVPAAPALVGSYDTPGYARNVTVSGDLAFVADQASSLHFVDISDPAAPTLVGSYDTPGYAFDVAVSGDRAFVAAGDSGLQIIQFGTDEFSTSLNTGQSLVVDGEDETILRARLTTTQTAGVTWELSADAGGSWTATSPGATWTSFGVPGAELLWRSTHTVASLAGPAVSDLTLEWLNQFGRIKSVTDITNDQGRQVSLEWQRSGHDFLGDPQQIMEYAVYRQIDPALKVSNMGVVPTGVSSALQAHALSAKAAGWHFITTVPVRVQDDYAVVVPTLADSTVAGGLVLSTFMVSALTSTPGVFFDSPEASGYSVDNLAPSAPANLLLTGGALSWDEPTDADFDYFTVYGSSEPVPTGLTMLGHTTDTSLDVSGSDYAYLLVAATDFAGNEGEPTVLPRYCAINISDAQNYGPGCDPDPALCIDEQVRLDGIIYVVKDYSSGGHYMQGDTGGINFYDPDAIPLTPGDRIRISGSLWYDDNGEIYVGWPSITVLGNEPIPAPQVVETGSLQDCGIVGSYVEARGTVTATGINEQGYEYYTLDDGSGPVMVYIDPDTGADMSSVDVGETRWVRSPAMLFSGEIRLSPISAEHHADNTATSIADGDMPLAFRIHGAIPNPFNPMTTIRFELGHRTDVDLEVYDLSGRLIRRLVAHEQMDGGIQDRVWDGTDEDGIAVPTGVYLCRMSAGGYQEAIRMVLLK